MVWRQERRAQCVRVACSSHDAARNGERRVVVTGMGVVSCLGHEVEEFYNGLLEVLLHKNACLIFDGV